MGNIFECRFTVRHVKGIDNIPSDYFIKRYIQKRENEKFLYVIYDKFGNIKSYPRKS